MAWFSSKPKVKAVLVPTEDGFTETVYDDQGNSNTVNHDLSWQYLNNDAFITLLFGVVKGNISPKTAKRLKKKLDKGERPDQSDFDFWDDELRDQLIEKYNNGEWEK